MADLHRRHYCLHFDELARRAGVQGEIIRVWVELDNDYIHIVTEDPTAKPTARGGYVEIESLPNISNTGDTKSTGEPNG